MDINALETLEWNKIVENIQGFCKSSIGRKKVEELEIFTDLSSIEREQDFVSHAIELVLKYSNPQLYGIYDFTEICRRLERGAILENDEFIKISDSFRVAASLRDYVKEYSSEENTVVNRINKLYKNKRIEEEINRIIKDSENIHDQASAKLFSIRRSIRNKMDDIRRRLGAILQDKDSSSNIRESIVTMRDGRYVVPVKREAKSKFPGIIHDQSATGQTLFIEPMVVVELNNDIRNLEIEEREEIRRILKELSELCCQYKDDILGNQEILVFLDMTFAKAAYGLEIKGTRPIMNDKKFIDMKAARHPLLKGEVVPIDVKISDICRAIIITGPNTGGKTVSLKTIGLITLMAQAGLFVPCAEFSKLAIFDNIYTDIGDKQSIELSLSTFSASISNIVRILNNASSKSLVLFDELGSGTDPAEGAALAMAIIDGLVKRELVLVATTHYSELKLYAMTRENIQNASVEFDVESLSPTYRLIIGSPGKSNAFEISKRLGLDKTVIDNALSYISKENRDFENLISGIEEDRIRMEEETRELLRLKDEYRKLNEKLSLDIEDKRKKALEEVEKSKFLARKILEDAKKESKDLLKMAKANAKGSTNQLDRVYSEITDKFQEFSEKYEGKVKVKKNNKKLDLKLGQNVKIVSMNEIGIVQTLPDNKGDLTVQVGILKFNSNISDIELTDEDIKKEKQKTSYRNILSEKAGENYSRELDLRGENVLDAIGKIEKFFDNSILFGLKEVNIIHGKGTGALRAGINDYLKKSKYVDKYRIGDLKEGGAGVTVVTLK
ncbi:endonuclease MutS2 [Peptoniphilaceae bacterium SGI.131]